VLTRTVPGRIGSEGSSTRATRRGAENCTTVTIAVSLLLGQTRSYFCLVNKLKMRFHETKAAAAAT